MKNILFVLLCLFISFNIHGQNVGSRVTFTGVDGKAYSGTINEVKGISYKVKYDGYDFEAWLGRQQFTIAAEGANNNLDINSIFGILNFGKQRGWASIIQENKLNKYWGSLTSQDQTKVLQFINQAKSNSAKFFVLKSLLSGDNFKTLQPFIQELNQYPESYQQEQCLITNHKAIIQQWEYSCSVTAVQTYLADLCPRYAWQVKKVKNFDIATNNANNPMAEQQKMLLEKYGGIASPRGDVSGKSIGINDALNDFVGQIVGVKYYAQEITQPLQTIFVNIRNIIDKGLDEPLLIHFEGTQVRHFILVMKYKNTNMGYQYLIYDPWDGVCDYVYESTILKGSLNPLLTQWRIGIDYYYPIQ